jgi:hypothetical protein
LITNLATLQKRVGIQARQAEDFLRTAESIDRTMALDKVLPSYGNIITLAGIQVGRFYRFTNAGDLDRPIFLGQVCSCAYRQTGYAGTCSLLLELY